MTWQTECTLRAAGYPQGEPTCGGPEKEKDDLRTLLALHAIAMGAMSHGVCVLDGNGRVVLFNQRLLEIFELSNEVMYVGMSFRALLELGVVRNHYTREAFGGTWRECKKKLQHNKPFVLCHRF